jgi:hypothetical protein
MFNRIEYRSLHFRQKVNFNKPCLAVRFKANLGFDILVGNPRFVCRAAQWQHPALSSNCALDNA